MRPALSFMFLVPYFGNENVYTKDMSPLVSLGTLFDFIGSIIKEGFCLRTKHASNFSHIHFASSLGRTLVIKLMG